MFVASRLIFLFCPVLLFCAVDAQILVTPDKNSTDPMTACLAKKPMPLCTAEAYFATYDDVNYCKGTVTSKHYCIKEVDDSDPFESSDKYNYYRFICFYGNPGKVQCAGMDDATGLCSECDYSTIVTLSVRGVCLKDRNGNSRDVTNPTGTSNVAATFTPGVMNFILNQQWTFGCGKLDVDDNVEDPASSSGDDPIIFHPVLPGSVSVSAAVSPPTPVVAAPTPAVAAPTPVIAAPTPTPLSGVCTSIFPCPGGTELTRSTSGIEITCVTPECTSEECCSQILNCSQADCPPDQIQVDNSANVMIDQSCVKTVKCITSTCCRANLPVQTPTPPPTPIVSDFGSCNGFVCLVGGLKKNFVDIKCLANPCTVLECCNFVADVWVPDGALYVYDKTPECRGRLISSTSCMKETSLVSDPVSSKVIEVTKNYSFRCINGRPARFECTGVMDNGQNDGTYMCNNCDTTKMTFVQEIDASATCYVGNDLLVSLQNKTPAVAPSETFKKLAKDTHVVFKCASRMNCGNYMCEGGLDRRGGSNANEILCKKPDMCTQEECCTDGSDNGMNPGKPKINICDKYKCKRDDKVLRHDAAQIICKDKKGEYTACDDSMCCELFPTCTVAFCHSEIVKKQKQDDFYFNNKIQFASKKYDHHAAFPNSPISAQENMNVNGGTMQTLAVTREFKIQSVDSNSRSLFADRRKLHSKHAKEQKNLKTMHTLANPITMSNMPTQKPTKRSLLQPCLHSPCQARECCYVQRISTNIIAPDLLNILPMEVGDKYTQMILQIDMGKYQGDAFKRQFEYDIQSELHEMISIIVGKAMPFERDDYLHIYGINMIDDHSVEVIVNIQIAYKEGIRLKGEDRFQMDGMMIAHKLYDTIQARHETDPASLDEGDLHIGPYLQRINTVVLSIQAVTLCKNKDSLAVCPSASSHEGGGLGELPLPLPMMAALLVIGVIVLLVICIMCGRMRNQDRMKHENEHILMQQVMEDHVDALGIVNPITKQKGATQREKAKSKKYSTIRSAKDIYEK